MYGKLPDYCNEMRLPKLAAVFVIPTLLTMGFSACFHVLGADRQPNCGERTVFKIIVSIMSSEISLMWWEEIAYSTIVIDIFSI